MREEDLFGDEREGGMDEPGLTALRQRMRRVQAPPGFAEKVLLAAGATAGSGGEGADGRRPGRGREDGRSPEAQGGGPNNFAGQRLVLVRRVGSLPAMRAAGIAAAVLLILLLPVGGYLHERSQQAQAETVARQFALAMRLTHDALEDAGVHAAAHTRLPNREHR